MKLILHVPVVIDQTGHLFLQPVILLHQQLIHCTQLPIHSLQARGLLALLLPASANHKKARSVAGTPHTHKSKRIENEKKERDNKAFQ